MDLINNKHAIKNKVKIRPKLKNVHKQKSDIFYIEKNRNITFHKCNLGCLVI